MASSRTFRGKMDSLRTYSNRGMARRDISGLYFNTDIGPVPTPPGPELTASKMCRRSSRTRSRVTRGMRAIMFSSRTNLEQASRRVVDQGHGIIPPATTLDKRGFKHNTVRQVPEVATPVEIWSNRPAILVREEHASHTTTIHEERTLP